MPGGLSVARRMSADRRLMSDTYRAGQIELENSGYHDDRLGPISIFEQRVPERLGAVDEQATATMLLILHDPVAAAVLADKKEGRSGCGRFLFAHDTSRSMLEEALVALGVGRAACAREMCPRAHMNARRNGAACYRGDIKRTSAEHRAEPL
jgi:hypothetical protein